MADDVRERILKRVADDMMAAMLAEGAYPKPRPTALRPTPWGSFETVELADDGSIIEPPKRCRLCGVILCAKHMAMVG